ncbi:tyrosine-protein phosphatase [uncultured Ruthenibacterium sp.]|uniref:tyrosine-protein phosphatase n=1 Tax=uncultured Ruthenibacterium sp. TaxID=1905347 RepID=UPI00349ED198
MVNHMNESGDSWPGQPLPFVECENFRELGGYCGLNGKSVKHGVFFRGPALCDIRLKEDQERFLSLGIRTILDFRSESEKRHEPDPTFDGIDYISRSALRDAQGKDVDFDIEAIFAGGEQTVSQMLHLVEDGYAHMPFDNDAYRELFRILAHKRVPVYFHCSAGKDRTGIGAALILLALGVDRETVIQDYLITNTCRPKARAQIEKVLKRFFPEPRAAELAAVTAGVQRSSIERALNAIEERYPRFEDYLMAECDVNEKTLDVIRQMYLV